jgi:hypothetical protein
MSIEQLIFTDCPRGQGVEPEGTGLQVKACSAGVTPELRWTLHHICMHHGQAYTVSYAPPAAIEIERAWLVETDDRATVPGAVLEAFPVLWSYDRLTNDLFALTRVEYSCLTHDGRTGNIFAHALIFSPDALAPYNGNPLALMHSDLFLSSDTGRGTELPALPNLGDPPNIPPQIDLLGTDLYRDQLPAMITALSAASPAHRPVVLCLPDWQTTASLVEALLSLLPPSARSQITICTYESDRTWVTPTKAGRPEGLASARHLLALHSVSSLNLRPDEYQSIYAVFNFVDGKFSPFEAISPYAAFATHCVLNRQMERLDNHHQLAERLGMGCNVKAWDTLATTVPLFDDTAVPEQLSQAAHALADLATQPDQMQTALNTLLPRVQAWGDHQAALAALSQPTAALIDRLRVNAEEFAVSVIDGLAMQAQTAFVQGRVRIASTLLQACGQAREQVLLDMLATSLTRPDQLFPSSLPLEDRKQAVTLLLDGLRLLQKPAEVQPLETSDLLMFTFRVASEAGLTDEVWKSIGETLVKPQLEGEWSDLKEMLATGLLQHITPSACPDGYAWISVSLLKSAPPQGDILRDRLVTSAYAGARSADAPRVIQNIVQIAIERFSNPDQQALILGRMADAAFETASYTPLYTAYQDAAGRVKPKGRERLLVALADADAADVICDEMFAKLLPWDNDSNNVFQHWHRSVLQDHPRVMDRACKRVAASLKASSDRQDWFALARKLLALDAPEEPGFLALYEIVALNLPLEPLAEQWHQALGSVPDRIGADAGIRLRVLRFMREVDLMTRKPDWSVTQFPYQNSIWQQDFQALTSSGDRKRALEWSLGTLLACGVTQKAEAQALADMLTAINLGTHHIADALVYLIDRRDPVTQVLAIMAFAQLSLESPGPDDQWEMIVKDTLEQLGKDTQRLFAAHLLHRFAPRDHKYEARRQRLCSVLGIAPPKAAAQETARANQPLNSMKGNLISETRRRVRQVISVPLPRRKKGEENK